MVRMEDVSDKVLQAAGDKKGADREEAVRTKIEELKAEATKGNHYKAEIKPFFDGNEYYLFLYERYDDIRLVGAPPSAIGKFGGDTDNWMWPRHTGDFAMFRVYMSPDGKPAAYSPNNIPLKPRHHLPISLKGVKKGDYAMIMGYPGSTDRFLTSYGVQQETDMVQPARVMLRGTRLELMKKDMDQSDKVRIQYASNYAQISNYWKYFIGQTRGLKRLHVYEKKKAEEEAFQKWVDADPERKKKYGNVINDIASAYKELSKYALPETYLSECVFGMEINMLLINFKRMEGLMSKEGVTPEQVKGALARIAPAIEDYFKNHNAPTDINVMTAMLGYYHKNISADFHPKELTDMHAKYNGDFRKWVENYYATSVFTDEARLKTWMENPDKDKLLKDEGYALMSAFLSAYRDFSSKAGETTARLEEATRLYVDGLRKMNPNKKYYPNANFTLRLTYGSVLDYSAADAVMYNYYTTLDGIMEKEDPKNEEFIVPAKLKELWKNKDYGQYGENGVMKVAFLTNTDITGGNSGSPVINAKGELIGCAFDGNWEAMSGDIAFEHQLQRTISVDIRYVLFVVDKYAGAGHLVKEMTLVK
jgi:hypothetical protein